MEIIGSTAGTSFGATGLTNGEVKWYSVRAKNTSTGVTGRRAVAIEYIHGTNVNACTDCDNGSINTFPYEEGFESGIGDWCQETTDDMDWTRKTGSTSSSNTGPTAAGEGSYYMYTEASSPNYPSKRALLTSPCFDFPAGADITMTYDVHMYGSSMGTLILEASTDNGVTWNSVWTLSGDQGNNWFSGLATLDAYAGNKTILRFNGLTGNSYTSDMSIDRIKISTNTPVCSGGISSFPYTQNFDAMTLWWKHNIFL